MKRVEQDALFEAWLLEHAKVLHHVAHGFAAGTDRDDLLQELLLAVWKAVPAYRANSRPATFIYRVAHNAALTWRRSQGGYRRRLAEFEALHLSTSVAWSGGSGEAEALTALFQCIRELPPLDRSLILLHLDQVGYAEIAAIHGLTETNVGVRLNRLKQRLSTAMQTLAHELR